MRVITAELRSGKKKFRNNVTDEQISNLKKGDVIKYVCRAMPNERFDAICVYTLSCPAGLNGFGQLTVFAGTWMVAPADVIDVMKADDAAKYGNPEEFCVVDFDENSVTGIIEKRITLKRD